MLSSAPSPFPATPLAFPLNHLVTEVPFQARLLSFCPSALQDPLPFLISLPAITSNLTLPFSPKPPIPQIFLQLTCIKTRLLCLPFPQATFLRLCSLLWWPPKTPSAPWYIKRKRRQVAKEEIALGSLCLGETAPKAWRAIPGAHLQKVINKKEWFQGRVLWHMPLIWTNI